MGSWNKQVGLGRRNWGMEKGAQIGVQVNREGLWSGH